MKKAYVYILGANPNPDLISCQVPFQIDKHEIFFGSCKKRLRQHLKYLNSTKIKDDIYLIGLNSSNSKKIRKIIWVGRIKKAMTFKDAFTSLRKDTKYDNMFNHSGSPLNLEPITNGYRLRSELHKDNCEWISDLVPKGLKENRIDYEDDTVVLKERFNDNDVFERDSCYLLENIFYTQGEGIEITLDILNLFKKAQPGNRTISNYAIFGLNNNGSTIGKTGSWLEIEDKITNSLINIIKKKALSVNNKKESSKKSSGKGGKC